jgi:drug/metabolite transporter (DMT)-like permease
MTLPEEAHSRSDGAAAPVTLPEALPPSIAGYVPKPLPTAKVWLGIGALVLAAGLWSLNGPLIKILHRDELSPWVIACYRSLVGGIGFAPFAWRYRASIRHVTPPWPLISVLCFTLMTACFVIANTMTAAASAIVLQYTSPLWVFLLAPLVLGERPGLGEGASLLISMAGIAVIVVGNFDTDLIGPVVALGSGLGYGALTVVLRRLRYVHPAVVVALNALGSGFVLIIPVAIWGEFGLTARQLGLVVFMGLVQFTLPYAIFSWGLRYVEAHRAALIVLLECVLNPLWTYLAVGEKPPTPTLLGGPLVLLGVAVWLLARWRVSRDAATV